MYLTFYLASDLDIAYFNNTVFLSRSNQVKFAPRKFEVLKINIYPRSDATRTNMLVLRISHFHTNVVASKQKQEKKLKRVSGEEKREKMVQNLFSIKLSRGGSRVFCVKLNFVPIAVIAVISGLAYRR